MLADSSVVTLALPKILAQFDVKIETLAWVLTSFNLALALAAVPAAFAARRRPALVFGAGAIIFAAASLACGFAPSIEVLIGGRAVQGVAGAAVVCAALDLLSGATGGDAPAARVWALSGILGAAFGPAAGGILTQLLGWESVFLVQAPPSWSPCSRCAAPERSGSRSPRGGRTSPPTSRCCSSPVRSSRATFLLVLLLINGWRLDPLAAGLVVTVMPLAAIVAARTGARISPQWARAASGAILIAGGSAALGLATARRSDLDPGTPARDRRRARPRPLSPDRAGSRRPFGAGGPRRLDDRGPPRGDRPRPASC